MLDRLRTSIMHDLLGGYAIFYSFRGTSPRGCMTEGALWQEDNRGETHEDGLLGCYDCPRDHKICEKSPGTTRIGTGSERSSEKIARGGPDNIRDGYPSPSEGGIVGSQG